MITQRDLKAVLDARRRAEELRLQIPPPPPPPPPSSEQLAYQAAAQEAADRLASIVKRVEAGEKVQAGKYQVTEDVKTSTTVSWKDFWSRIRELPLVARVLGEDPDAQRLIKQATERDPKAPFVSERVTRTLDVVLVDA